MPELLECLENLFMSETTYTDAKTVLGKPRLGKKDRQLLAEWVQQGYFVVETNADGKKDYALSNEGQRILQQDNQRWYVLQARKNRKQKRKLREFLEIIDDKSGKMVSARDLEKFNEQLEKSLHDKAIIEVASQKYCLSAYGKALLLSLHPPGEILDQLAQSLQQLTEKSQNIRSAQQDALKDILAEEPQLYGFVQQGIAMMEQHLNCALEELIRTQRHLATLEISQQTRERLHQDIKTIRDNFYDAFDKIREEMISRQETLFDNLQNQLARLQNDFDENQRHFTQEAAAIKKLHAQLIEFLPADTIASEQPEIPIAPGNDPEEAMSQAPRDPQQEYQASYADAPETEVVMEHCQIPPEKRIPPDVLNLPFQNDEPPDYRQDNGWGNNTMMPPGRTGNRYPTTTPMPVEKNRVNAKDAGAPYYKTIDNLVDHASKCQERVATGPNRDAHPHPPVSQEDSIEDIEVTVDEEAAIADSERFELESEREYQVETKESVIKNRAEETRQRTLREIRDYYIRTYWHHHGELALKDLFAYLQSKLGLGRFQVELHLLQLKNDGQILLRQTFSLDEFGENEVIEHQGRAYFALQIPDLTDI